MIIVNTTFVLHHTVSAEVRQWIKDSYLQSAARKGALPDRQLFTRVLDTGDAHTETYALHICFPDLDTARRWNDGFGSGLRRVLAERWGERALAFHTFMEVAE